MEIVREQVVERTDSNSNIIKETLEYFGEIAERREEYQAAIMESQGGNYAGFRQTSYDMAPK
jgi:uncharacterized protein (UPF0335 family)